MIELCLLLLIVCASGIQGAQDYYTYYDQADGWLKYYNMPAAWEDAKIRCDSDGAVLASPLTGPLRDVITRHILAKDPTASNVYTGVHADFASGDFFSIEGHNLAQLSVPLRAGKPISYNSQASCVAWDVNYSVLKKAKCNSRLPSICYKKRIDANLPVGPSVPIGPSGPVAPSGPVVPNVPVGPSGPVGPNVPEGPSGPVGPNVPEGPSAPVISATPLENSTNITPEVLPRWPDQRPPTNQSPQTNPGSQTNRHPQTNQTSPTNVRPPTEPRLPANQGQQTTRKKIIHKCTADAKTLIVINSNMDVALLRNLPDNAPVTVIFSNLTYIKQLNSTWRSIVQNPRPLNQTQSGSITLKPNNGTQRPTGNVPPASRGHGPHSVNSTISIPGTQPHGNLSVYQPNRVNQSDNHPTARPNNRNPDVSQHGPSERTNENEPSGSSPNNNHRKPVTNLGYEFKREAEGWLKFHQPATWDEAYNRCASEGAVIASPLTPQLHNAISYYVAEVDRSVRELYSGVHASFSNGDFFSSEGVSLSKMSVVLDQGADIKYDNSMSCIVMSVFDDVVTSVRCTDKLPYVCYKKRTMVYGCDKRYPGYTYEKRTESCYKFHTQPKTWQAAYEKCRDENAYLMVTNSDVENLAMMDLFRKYPAKKLTGHYKDNVYVGRRDWLDGESWKTVQGISLPQSGFVGWAHTEPNNAGGHENCGTMNRNGFMYDDPCGLLLSFICEKKPELFDDPDMKIF